MTVLRSSFGGLSVEKALHKRSTLDSLVLILFKEFADGIQELQQQGPITETRGHALDERLRMCILLFDGLVKPHAQKVSLDIQDQLTSFDKLIVSLLADINTPKEIND